MKESLHNYFLRYVSLSESEITLLFESIELKEFNKKDFLLKEGKVCSCKYFIVEGLIRSYQTDIKGNENISYFGIENWWVTNLDSFVNESPSIQSIQALENTKVLCIRKAKLEELYGSIPNLERAFRMITENMLIAIQRKDEIYMKMSSKERYNTLVSQIPKLSQRVPLFMIASYLSITPEYLSEIRKNRS